MNDQETILQKLEEHKEHATIFREELKLGLNTVSMKLQELTNHQKIANGRTGKLEETVSGLQRADVLMGEQLKNMRDGNKRISDRMWAVITSIISILVVSLIMWLLSKK